VAYATVSHVEARNRERAPYTANTKPTKDDVLGFLEQARGQIDTTLVAAGYSVPATFALLPSHTQVLLEDVNAAGAAYYVEWAAAVSDKRGEYEDLWQSALKMIRTTELDLDKDSAQSLPRQGPIASPAFFSRDMEL
jgi:hypothetical protein